ncbi:MAG: hypothetical protein JNL54_01405 [Kineosporiaceae bacterium]|nr:hypothetical protein [Kineosporiaceae bacterium]
MIIITLAMWALVRGIFITFPRWLGGWLSDDGFFAWASGWAMIVGLMFVLNLVSRLAGFVPAP